MKRQSFVRPGAVGAALFLLVACGGGEQTSQSPVPAPAPAPSPGPTPTPAPAGSLTLVWSPNTETDLQGYRVYFGTAPGSYAQARGAGLSTGSATEFTVTGLQLGATYYFAVTAYDNSGNESGYSAELAAVPK